MGKYSINDFEIGDKVYHLSNTRLTMVVVEINTNINEVSCRWIDKDGKTHCVEFLSNELGKSNDLSVSFL